MSLQERIRALLASSTGIELPLGGSQSLDAFVGERCRALGLSSPESYFPFLQVAGDEFQRLVDAVTVKYTWFFRDLPQIESLRQLLQKPREEALYVWVPGCASGEDAYTVALVAAECGADVRVLGTDVSADAIALARRAQYGAWSTRDVPQHLLRYFIPGPGQTLSPGAGLSSKVSFRVHNVLSPAPVPANGRGWDVILCRNVLMYFGQSKAQATARSLARSLSETGHLLLGASDVLIEPPPEVVVEYVAGRVVLRRALETRAARGPGAGAPTPSSPDPIRLHELSLPVAPARPEEPAADSSLNAAHVHLSAGRLDLAVRDYARACEAEPVAIEPRLYGGIAHYLSGDLPRALESLRAALLLDHKCWPASYYLGLCYESMGRARDAEREYDRAAKQSEREPLAQDDPNSPLFGFRRDLAWLARRRSRARQPST